MVPRNCPWGGSDDGVSSQRIKAAIVNMSKGQKETMFKDFFSNVMMTQQVKIISILKWFLKSQWKLWVGNTITKMKISSEGLNSRYELAKGRISEFEDRSVNIIQSEEQKEKKHKEKWTAPQWNVENL